MNDLLTMDNTYPSRIALRKTLIEEKGKDVLAVNDIAIPAVVELYTYLVTSYLPTRFPTVYTTTLSGLQNKVNEALLPLHPSTAVSALRHLGENIDTDLLLLLPTHSPSSNDQVRYHLQAFITCFPSGFNTHSKLGLSLSAIHSPVPSYAARLEKSMDRFFANLPIGKTVKRHNWSVTTDPTLFNLAGNHMSAAEEQDGAAEEEQKEDWHDIDLAKTVLRCERQTLHRLPETGAILFAFKTYVYPVKELRDEGSGEELARAIEGLGQGNAPGMVVYKRQIVWGEKVKAFLRGEIGLDGEAVGTRDEDEV
jgi:hypothetical protein